MWPFLLLGAGLLLFMRDTKRRPSEVDLQGEVFGNVFELPEGTWVYFADPDAGDLNLISEVIGAQPPGAVPAADQLMLDRATVELPRAERAVRWRIVRNQLGNYAKSQTQVGFVMVSAGAPRPPLPGQDCIDAHMPPNIAASVVSVMGAPLLPGPQSRSALLVVAAQFEAAGYPRAAACIRTRAEAF